MATPIEMEQEKIRIEAEAKAAATAKAAASQLPSTTEDVLRSTGAGLRRGVEGIPGMVGDVSGLGRAGLGKVAGWMGADPETQKAITDYNIPYLPDISSETIHEATTPLFGESYKPQTTLGRYAATGAEFLPGMITSPGKTIPQAIGKGAIAIGSGLASEAAGEATEGTKLEPWARAGIGMLTGGAGEAAVSGRKGAVTAGSRAAEAAAEDEASRFGVKLTKGQRTGDVPQQRRELEMLNAQEGSWAQRRMKARQDDNMRAIKDAGLDIADQTAPTRGGTPVQSGTQLNQQVRERTGTAMKEGGKKMEEAIHSGVMTPADHLRGLPNILKQDLAGPTPFVPEHVLGPDTPMANSAMDRVGTFVEWVKDPDYKEFSLAGAEKLRQQLALLQAAPGSTDSRALGQIRDSFEEWLHNGAGQSRIDPGQIPPGSTAPSTVEDVLSGLQSGRDEYRSGARVAKPRKNERGMPGADTVSDIATTASDESTTRLFTPDAKGNMSKTAIDAVTRLAETGATKSELDQVRGIIVEHLTGAEGPGRIATRVENFVNNNPTVANKLFSPDELKNIGDLGKTSKRLVPEREAMNPSQSSYPIVSAVKKGAQKTTEQGAGMVGTAVGGVPGYFLGTGLMKGANEGINALVARSAINEALSPADRRTLAQIILQGGASGTRIGAIPAVRELQRKKEEED